jgi:hypothetical protein
VSRKDFPPLTPANSSSSSEEEEESDGGAPLRGGIPRPRRHGPRRWPWIGARGGRGGARRRDVSGGIRERRGGAGERHGDVGGHYNGAL